MDKAKMPSLQVRSIQARRVAPLRWPAGLVFSPSRSLQVLLAPLLLGYFEGRGVSTPQRDSSSTSNDLLESRIAENTLAALNDQIVAHCAVETEVGQDEIPVSQTDHQPRSR
jgi:hypothetical protein